MALADRYFEARNRILSSSTFQRWAASFPLTRPVARRRSKALFDLCAGFVYSQILQSCIKLRMFEALAKGPMTASQFAQFSSLPVDAAERLLKAAVSLDLACRRGADRFGLGVLGAALLGNPAIADLVDHHAMLYEDLVDPIALLRGTHKATRLSGYWPYSRTTHPQSLSTRDITGYSSLMSASQTLIAHDILDAYPLTRHRCMLDVGGGQGTFLLAAAQRAPSLQLKLFDLPPVAERARDTFEAAGISGRAEAHAGNFLIDALPEGADVVSLIRILHDHDDDEAMQLLRRCREAVATRGVLLLAEPMSATPGADAVADAYFAFYLMAMGSGRPRTPTEISTMLTNAGFSSVRHVGTRRPFLTSLLVAEA